MQKIVMVLLITVLAAVSLVQAETNVNVTIGVPGPRVVMPPPPPPMPPPRVIVSGPPAVLFEVEPFFLAPSRLGFYVGVDTPYDIIYNSNYYYLYYGNGWHKSRYYNGPWNEVPYRQLPPGIRKHRIEQIRSYRDREYRVYRDERDHYHGRQYRPGHGHKDEWKEDRKREKQERKEEKRDRKHDKHDRD